MSPAPCRAQHSFLGFPFPVHLDRKCEMTRYVIRRLLQAIPTVLGISIIIFVLMRIVPGDPATMVLDPLATPEDRAAFCKAHGLDRPIVKRGWIYHRPSA